MVRDGWTPPGRLEFGLVTERSNSTTRVEAIYADLKSDILSGRRSPGDRIRLKELADARGVSLTVVREAVTRLAAEGSVEASPQQGFRVRSISILHLRDLTWMRTQIESLALRESIERGDLAWESQLVAAHHTLASTPIYLDSGDPSPAWRSAHDGFHAALTSACGSELLLQIRQQLFDASELYRSWSAQPIAGVAPETKRSVVDEHREILEATLRRDGDRAVELLSAHLERTTKILIDVANTSENEMSSSHQDERS